MKVTAELYTHEFHFLSKHEVFFGRHEKYRPNYKYVDVFGGFWSFLFAKIPQNSVSVTLGENTLAVEGKVGILVPPHSIVQWTVQHPQLHWFAYSNNAPYPDSYPKDITVYKLTEIPETVSPTWITQLVLDHNDTNTVKFFGINPYALKLKALLDIEYKFNKPLHEYSTELGLSKEWLIKYFKKSYGITPVDYRNKKRIMETLFLLHVENEKIVDLSQSMGFNDLKHFNALFKKAISLPPSKFISRDHSL
jgi:AraC-like DNA-binding protein